MSIRRLAGITTTVLIVVAFLSPASVAYANAAPSRTTLAFEFVDDNSQPVSPASLQLVRCEDEVCQPVFLDLELGECGLSGCREGIPPYTVQSAFQCAGNFCRGDVYTWATWHSRQLVLIPQSEVAADQALVGLVPKPERGLGKVAGWRVVITPDGLVITEDFDVAARIPTFPAFSCGFTTPPAMIGFAVTQAAELLVGLGLLLMLGLNLRLIGGVLVTMGLINFATFPVVWLTFPALGPGPNTQEQAVAVFTLLAALVYASLLLRLRPAFDPARRAIAVGLLAVALPMVTALVFGAASVASAAASTLGAAGTAGAGLPYYVTMPASEVFAFSAEALLIYLLCRPVLSARQAVLLSVLANSASLALGLYLL